MSVSMYQASIPVLIHNLRNLSAILKKAAAHAKARNIDPAVLVNARIFPDMYPLVRQVQIASDISKGGAARLAGVEVPSFADTETTFAELQERLARTIAFLRSIRPAQLEGSETRVVNLQMRTGAISFPGQHYMQGWLMPNLYFHIATAYNILRHNGVELGKGDFLGNPPGAVVGGKLGAKRGKATAGSKSKTTDKK